MMFVSDGWLSPTQVLDQIYSEERLLSESISDAEKNTYRAFSKLLRSSASGAILMPDGRMVAVQRHFLGRVLCENPFHHRYFDIRTGEVGRSSYGVQDRTKHLLAGIRIMSKQMMVFLALGVAVGVVVSALVIRIAGDALLENFWLTQSVLVISSLVMLMVLIFGPVYSLRRRSYQDCRAYAGGHLMLRPGAVSDFIRERYGDETIFNNAQKEIGRPRHPAFAWFEERGFDGGSVTMKQLQAMMPKDEKGAPPSESTIRQWRREFRQKPPQ